MPGLPWDEQRRRLQTHQRRACSLALFATRRQKAELPPVALMIALACVWDEGSQIE